MNINFKRFKKILLWTGNANKSIYLFAQSFLEIKFESNASLIILINYKLLYIWMDSCLKYWNPLLFNNGNKTCYSYIWSNIKLIKRKRFKRDSLINNPLTDQLKYDHNYVYGIMNSKTFAINDLIFKYSWNTALPTALSLEFYNNCCKF